MDEGKEKPKRGRPPKDGRAAMSNAERQARRKDRVVAMEAQLEWLAGWVERTLRELDNVEEVHRKGGAVSFWQVRRHVEEMQTRLKPDWLDYLTDRRTRWRREKASPGKRV